MNGNSCVKVSVMHEVEYFSREPERNGQIDLLRRAAEVMEDLLLECMNYLIASEILFVHWKVFLSDLFCCCLAASP